MLAFLLIMGISFYVMGNMLIGIVGEQLYTQRTQSERLNVGNLAQQLSKPLLEMDLLELDARLGTLSGDLGGRLLILDEDGKVLCDSAGSAYGTRAAFGEAVAVLEVGLESAYGLHRSGDEWLSRSAVRMSSSDTLIGTLVFESAVTDLLRELDTLKTRTLVIFLSAAIAALIASLVFSSIITNPIAALTRAIQKMGRGDFSVRAEPSGSGELRELARTFNVMSEKLESLDQTRNQFVSDASHELKTPLASIKILVQSLIYQPEMPSELRSEFLSDVDKEIDRLTQIVTDLLTLTRMDAHNVRLSRERMRLRDLVEETEHRLRPMAENRGQTILLSIDEDGEMYADRAKLAQIVYNLMDNAIKYTQPGGIVRVSIEREGRSAVLTVSDNGPGIPKDKLPFVFDRFYRVDKARSRETGGTGLGLAIVRQLVLMHGGSAHVESEEGKGSAFIVELPLHQG